MTDRYPPINPACPHMLHGGDYNPDQWIDTPEVWDRDMRLMKLAGCNAMSVGIFSWTSLEPADGKFEFDWLDRIMDKLADNNAYAVLATPSGARPAWLSQMYPEVLRVDAQRRRQLHGRRHNHCFTSPIYRRKIHTINYRLAGRYKDHPALLVWHISNEYGGECHCPLCQDAFRAVLRERYGDGLDRLNHAWWTRFWSHTFTDWSQIESPSPIGESAMHGLNLDWKRFVTHQTIDFMRNEMEPLRDLTPDVPITTNFMGIYPGLNYFEMARELDVVSWDSYPPWHSDDDACLASDIGFLHDLNRSLKGGKPFMLMESVPSATNWARVCKLKRPGMHMLSSLQAVAHGSDTVQYFQWRKGRGASEKFHGAVVDHVGNEHTRVFRDVADVGEVLAKLDDVVGTTTPAEVALVFDWENRWAIEDAQALGRDLKMSYPRTAMDHYHAFWKRGQGVDIVDSTGDLATYKLVVAPMLYMLRGGMAERLAAFVEGGGTLVMTYWSGLVDQSDLCFLGGWPGGTLRQVMGIRDEEIDALHPGQTNTLVPTDAATGLAGPYEVHGLCGLIHAEDATVLATYGEDFYAAGPALTVNQYGKGRAYYVAARTEQAFLDDFYRAVTATIGIAPALDADPPAGVSVAVRADGTNRYVFLMNFTTDAQTVDVGVAGGIDLLSGQSLTGPVALDPYDVKVLHQR